MSDFLRDKRVLLVGFIIIGMVMYVGYRAGELGTDIDLTKGSINFTVVQSGMVDSEDILVFGRTVTSGQTYQIYELRNDAELRPVTTTRHKDSIKNDAQISYMAAFTYDNEATTNEALYLKTDVVSSSITIEEVSVYSASNHFIRKYEHEPAKSDSYSIFLYTTDLDNTIDGGVYLQYKGFVMEGLNRASVVLSIFIQIIEGS